MDITNLTLVQTLKALEDKDFSLEELNKAYLERIKKYNPQLNAFLDINEKSGGIPAAVKSLISTKGFKTSAGSKIIENYLPPFNATVIEHLIAEGVSVIGKTNQDEFAMGSSGENSAFGPTKNPWDLSKVPGGSSSGSAVAVAADLAVFSLGTDTGGSIRQPASLSGVVGLKPSYGRVSRYGLMAMASSLDQIGPLTKTVEDAKIVLEAISGKDGLDSTSVDITTRTVLVANRYEDSPRSKQDIKIGLPKEYFIKGLDPAVEKVIKKAISKFEQMGAEIIEISLPHTEYALAAYYIIMPAEVSANLARYDGIKYGLSEKGDNLLDVYLKTRQRGFGQEPRRRIILGAYTLSAGYYEAYYLKAQKARTLIKKDFEEAFKKVDVLITPVSPTPAFKIGEKIDDPLKMYLSDIYTVPINLAGLPAISVPCGQVGNLPIGLQIIGKHFDEERILDLAQ